MIRYFISYKNLLEDNKLGRELDICSPELVILKKYKDGTYRAEPILYFNGYSKDIISCADKITQNKKGISLMVELTEKEAKKFNPLYVKLLEQVHISNINVLKEKRNKKDIKLLNYNSYSNMTSKELNTGTIHCFVSANAISNSDKYILRVLKNEPNSDKREDLIWSAIGNDIYFYTNDEEILEKYEDELTIFREEELDTYKLINHKIILIDSIPQDRIYDLNNESLRTLYQMCNSSIPISISENNNDTYNLSLSKLEKIKKKAYFITDFNIYNLLCNSLLMPLFKYINVYELKNGQYIKINIEEYMRQRDILKYIKKPS